MNQQTNLVDMGDNYKVECFLVLFEHRKGSQVQVFDLNVEDKWPVSFELRHHMALNIVDILQPPMNKYLFQQT